MPFLLAGCVGYAAAWVWASAVLPSRVPLHFGATGPADRWGSRGEALLTFGAVGALVALVVLAALAAVRRGRWRLVNVPHKAWWTATPERRVRLRELLEQDVGAVGCATMLLLASVLLGTVSAARAEEPELPSWVLLALGLYLLAAAAWVVLALTSRYRPAS